MTVSNEDILAWLRQSLVDLPGVELSIDQLDEADARELAYKALSLLSGMAHSQSGHLRLLDEALGNTESPEDRYALIWEAFAETMYLGVPGLRRLMREVEKREES